METSEDSTDCTYGVKTRGIAEEVKADVRQAKADLNGMGREFRARFDKITALQFTLLGGVVLSLLGIVFNIVTKK